MNAKIISRMIMLIDDALPPSHPRIETHLSGLHLRGAGAASESTETPPAEGPASADPSGLGSLEPIKTG